PKILFNFIEMLPLIGPQHHAGGSRCQGSGLHPVSGRPRPKSQAPPPPQPILQTMWRPDQLPIMLVDLAADALRNRSQELAAEQAVYGLDALSEVEFHPILAAAFRAAGLGVWPEQPYPGHPGKRPKRVERERCDLVLTESPDAPLRDPVAHRNELEAASG